MLTGACPCCPGLVRLLTDATGLERLDLSYSDKPSVVGAEAFHLEDGCLLHALSRLCCLTELHISRCCIEVSCSITAGASPAAWLQSRSEP